MHINLSANPPSGILIEVQCLECGSMEPHPFDIPSFLVPMLAMLLKPGSPMNGVEIPGNYLCQKCGEAWLESARLVDGLLTDGEPMSSGEAREVESED